MNAYTFNSNAPAFSPSWESFALRAGLCLLDNVCCVGHSASIILFEHSSEHLTPANKIKLLLRQLQQPEDIQVVESAQAIMQSIRRKKHRNKQDILTLKRGEKITTDIFEHYRQDILADLKKTGLPQLYPFFLEENKCLYVWAVNDQQGEPPGRGMLSQMLLFNQLEDEEDQPTVIIFYESLGLDVSKRYDCTPLVTLPNINLFEYEKLNNLRQRLEAHRNELAATLPLMRTEDGKAEYATGTWDLESVKELAPRLQQAVDSTPEMQWASELQEGVRAELLVGNMETSELWQLLYDHGIVPNDTWDVLQKVKQSGNYCPTIPFITIRSEWATASTINLSEDDSLAHKRRTIDLD